MTLPTKEELDALDMMPIYNQFRPVPEREYLLAPAGAEHYRLLKWVSHNIQGVFDEIGVYMGLGTACLASSLKNVVTGWDVDLQFLNWRSTPVNVHLSFSINEEWYSKSISKSNLVLIDAWHNGYLEQDIFNYMIEEDFKGILIYDDIYYNDAMKTFWNNISHPGKIDATHIGHSTGTGIIDFSI